MQTAPLRTVRVDRGADAAAPPAPSPVPGARNTENYKTQPKAVKEPYSEQALRDVAARPRPLPRRRSRRAPEPAAPPVVARADPKPAAEPPPAVARVDPPSPRPMPADGDDKVDWVWPAKGKIVTGFSEAASLKGIDIAGTSGQAVAASAGGKVVYAGTGLRGYGKLIIIKHNGTYLSAYAHNKEILVKEGQQVDARPEDRRDGQHRRRSGEAPLRDSPAGQAGRPAALPSARMSAAGPPQGANCSLSEGRRAAPREHQ